jgi:hypothetical protein
VIRIGELGTYPQLATDARCEEIPFLRSVRRFLVTASVVPSSPILFTLLKEALSSSESRFLQGPHGVTSQKTPVLTVTAVKISNLTRNIVDEVNSGFTFCLQLLTPNKFLQNRKLYSE